MNPAPQSVVSDAAVMAGIALASFGALAVAYVAQYGFDLWPCQLCWVQRTPYVGTLLIGGLALVLVSVVLGRG